MTLVERVPTKAELESLLERDWLSAKQAAQTLDRSQQMVWTMAKQGKLDVLRTPGGILYSRSDVERVLREREGVRR